MEGYKQYIVYTQGTMVGAEGSQFTAAKAREFVWSFEISERTSVDIELVITPAFFPLRLLLCPAKLLIPSGN